MKKWLSKHKKRINEIIASVVLALLSILVIVYVGMGIREHRIRRPQYEWALIVDGSGSVARFPITDYNINLIHSTFIIADTENRMSVPTRHVIFSEEEFLFWQTAPYIEIPTLTPEPIPNNTS